MGLGLAQGTFEFAYGGSSVDHVADIHVGLDGTYMSGATFSYGTVGEGHVTKLSGDGSVLWSASFTDTSNTHSWACTPLSDSGVVVIGNSSNFSTTPSVVHVVRFDKSGTLQWERFLDGQVGADQGNGVIEARDGGLVVTGTTTTATNGLDMFITKLSAQGNLVWSKRIGGTNNDTGIDLIEAPDSGFVAVGQTQSFGTLSATPNAAYIVKLSKTGTLLWSYAYELCAAGTFINGITSAPGGGYALAGNVSCVGFGNFDIAFLTIDGAGTAQAAHTFGSGNYENANGVKRIMGGGYIIVGHGHGPGYNDLGGFGNGFLLKLTAASTVQWAYSYGTMQGEILFGVDQKLDSGYVAAGLTMGIGAGMEDEYAISTNSAGQGPCSAQPVTMSKSNQTATRTSGGVLNSGPAVFTPSSTITSRSLTVTDNCGLLPLADLHLAAQASSGVIALEWELVGDAAVAAFVVMKSSNGAEFHEAGRMDGSVHRFADRAGTGKQTSYRVVAVLKDGARIHSNPVEVASEDMEPTLVLSPQPATDALHLDWTGDWRVDALRIMDMQGRQRWGTTLAPGQSHAVSIDCKGFAAGMYLLQLLDTRTGVVKQERFLIQ